MKVFDFSEALYELKLGKRVTRQGWNGKDMYIFIAPEGSVQMAHKTGGGHPIGDTLWMKTVDGNIVPWLASQTDLLADDWVAENVPVLKAFNP